MTGWTAWSRFAKTQDGCRGCEPAEPGLFSATQGMVFVEVGPWPLPDPPSTYSSFGAIYGRVKDSSGDYSRLIGVKTCFSSVVRGHRIFTSPKKIPWG